MNSCLTALALLALTGSTLCCLPGVEANSVYGKVILSPLPDSLPDKSFLTVQVSDTTKADTWEEVVSRAEYPVAQAYNQQRTLKYHVFVPDDAKGTLTIQAWLTIGWQGTAEERVRRGDYLTMSYFGFDASERDQRVDIELRKYA
ncbi:hypothetical protein BESB_018230 [Besnoitia besnoiti]|uniref:Transmembrane protein n=1 Tax=Besnoitia besnoiti TaxID=94643 RepID=A0A2A9M3H1_BESBE|nr:hypothetical protein BESB_018230 [Besnoitia besnoiti]PFH32505.1 hypothetical protein BESB_018230 [Besnoitia besnoiti]